MDGKTPLKNDDFSNGVFSTFSTNTAPPFGVAQTPSAVNSDTPKFGASGFQRLLTASQSQPLSGKQDPSTPSRPFSIFGVSTIAPQQPIAFGAPSPPRIVFRAPKQENQKPVPITALPQQTTSQPTKNFAFGAPLPDNKKVKSSQQSQTPTFKGLKPIKFGPEAWLKGNTNIPKSNVFGTLKDPKWNTPDDEGTVFFFYKPFLEKEPTSITQWNSFQSICFQRQFQKFSFEELKLIDYKSLKPQQKFKTNALALQQTAKGDSSDDSSEDAGEDSEDPSRIKLMGKKKAKIISQSKLEGVKNEEARKKAIQLKLLAHSTESQTRHDIKGTPVFTIPVLQHSKDCFSQYGFLAGMSDVLEKSAATTPSDPRVFFNIAAPSSTFICGSQGSGKSHTLACLLENCLVKSDVSVLKDPLSGLVFHYDSFTSDLRGSPCEAAFLASNPDIKVRILCSPANVQSIKVI